MLNTKSGRAFAKPRREIGDRFEADDLAQRTERVLDRVDGRGLIPLGVEIGLLEIVAEGAAESLKQMGEAMLAPAGLAGA